MMWNSIKVFSKRLFNGMFVLMAIFAVSWCVAVVLISGAGLVVSLVGGVLGLTFELVDKASMWVAQVVLCFVASFLVGKLVIETEE